MRELVTHAIDRLCVAFEQSGYNPTPIIDLGVLVVLADGVVDDKERAILRDVFQALLETKLSPEVVDHLVTASVQVANVAGVDSRARLVAEILVDCDAVEPGLTIALAVAFASDGLSDEERNVIQRIADYARLPRPRLEALVAQIRDGADGEAPASVRSRLSNDPRPTGS